MDIKKQQQISVAKLVNIETRLDTLSKAISDTQQLVRDLNEMKSQADITEAQKRKIEEAMEEALRENVYPSEEIFKHCMSTKFQKLSERDFDNLFFSLPIHERD